MVSLEKAVIARLKSHGKRFEVLVDPEGAFSIKKGEKIDVEKILAAEYVFEDAKKGEKASEEDLVNVFGTKNTPEVAEKIIKKGEIQLTSDQRKRLIEEKKREIIYRIATNAINPQTKAPHPPSRIESAMEEAGVHIDLLKPTEELMNEVVRAIRPIIPIKFEEIDIAVKIPSNYAAKAYGEMRAFQILQEEWQSDGSWIGVFRIPAGIQDRFYDLINKLTKGEAETKLIKGET
ncbi:MAG: ribosome assembly factor SBDS [Candidatus Syntropharchaeia archaeon]